MIWMTTDLVYLADCRVVYSAFLFGFVSDIYVENDETLKSFFRLRLLRALHGSAWSCWELRRLPIQ